MVLYKLLEEDLLPAALQSVSWGLGVPVWGRRDLCSSNTKNKPRSGSLGPSELCLTCPLPSSYPGFLLCVFSPD